MQVYRQSRNYENLNKRLFDGVGEYNIPPLKGASYKADKLDQLQLCARL